MPGAVTGLQLDPSHCRMTGWAVLPLPVTPTAQASSALGAVTLDSGSAVAELDR